MKRKLGVELCETDRRYVLRSYVHRFTKQHRPAWSKDLRPGGRHYMPQFATDLEWLQNTTFAVRNDGRLDLRCNKCESHPTWPDGQG